MQRILAALLIGAAALPAAAQQPAHKSACETLEFHFEREGAPPTSRRYVRPDTNLRVALNYAAIIDGHDIDSLWLERSYGDTARRDIYVRLTPQGALTLTKATRTHVDRHLAVLLGDSITFYAVIDSPTGREVPIAMSVDRQRARALLARAERARSTVCPAR